MVNWRMCLVAAWLAGPLGAETATFDLYLIGIKAGTLSLSSIEDGQNYAVSARIRAAGVAEVISDYRLEAQVSGKLTADGPAPAAYRERSAAGDDETVKSLTFTGALPVFETSETPRRHWLDPEDGQGALDPMTVVWELLRARETRELCQIDLALFDGARLGRLSAEPAPAADQSRICSGAYERLGGFSRKELRAGTRFPFTLVYERAGDGWRVARMDVQSTRGRAQLIRR